MRKSVTVRWSTGHSHCTSYSRLYWTWFKHSSVLLVSLLCGSTATRFSLLVYRLALPPSSIGRRFNVMTMPGQDEEMPRVITLLRTGTFAFLCVPMCVFFHVIFVSCGGCIIMAFCTNFVYYTTLCFQLPLLRKSFNINWWKRGKNNWSIFEKHNCLFLWHNTQQFIST